MYIIYINGLWSDECQSVMEALNTAKDLLGVRGVDNVSIGIDGDSARYSIEEFIEYIEHTKVTE